MLSTLTGNVYKLLKPATCHLLRYGLVVRIPGSHPGGPGSIPGNGNFDQLFLGKSRSPSPSILLRVSRAIYNICEPFKTADMCVKCLSVGAIEKPIPLYYSSWTNAFLFVIRRCSFCSVFCVVLVLGWAINLHKKDKKMSDEDGIRTHAGRAQWISSPSP